MMDIIDLYAGYEGEPEIVFQVIKNEKVVKTLNIWDGHLLFIVENCLKTEMGWRGIAGAYYNGDLDEEWTFYNLKECLEDLEETNVENVDDETKMVHKALVSIFKLAIDIDGVIKSFNN